MRNRTGRWQGREVVRRWGGVALLRLGAVGLVFGSVGFAYVAVKNQQTQYGKQQEKLETAILEMAEECRRIEGHIAILLERRRLKERLVRSGSSLRPISASEVIELVVERDVPGQASDVALGEREEGR